MSTHPIQKPTCYHCGQDCPPASDRYRQLLLDEKIFCCEGCKAVYELLSENQLCQYYDLEKSPGKSPRLAQFDFLDHAEIQAQLIEFTDGRIANVTLYCPSIHCSSCLYLLEHLYRIHPAIEGSRVDFLKKHVHIRFRPADVSLRQLAELLTSVGYEPLISLNDVVQEKQQPTYKPLLYRLAVAGFCAGNVMLLSFPEYLGLDDPSFRHLFGYLNVFLATPVVFYSGWGYFESVWAALRARRINIDLPILVGILTAYTRGIYEVMTQTGAGYFDSVTGLIFFLLIGKWFQQKTYAFLSFERDYKSYFPLAATRLRNGTEESVPIQSLRKGDHIRIRNQELIPADGILYKGLATIDYSFVTGEAEPEAKAPGTLLYAGGKQVGEAIEMEVVREVSQSYLTQLWNNDAFRKEAGGGSWAKATGRFADAVGKYFTLSVLTLATAVGLYWAWADPSKAINSFTAILIIACPCVLSLSYPFALGHGMRLLGRLTFYLKNTDVIERMAGCDTIVFDKTGTLTSVKAARITADFDYPLDGTETAMIASLVRNSTHPLSRQLAAHLAHAPALPVQHFMEITGRGILGLVAGQIVRLGARSFVNSMAPSEPEADGAVLHVSIDHRYYGCFRMGNRFREGIQPMLAELSKRYTLHLLSGDHEGARAGVEEWFPKGGQLVLACSPQGKLDFVRTLQEAGHRVIMVGDGLNDAGALKQADVGIAITDDTVQFTPSSDAILEASALRQLPRFLHYSRFGMRLIRFSFLISLIYNGIGLSFAIAGNLSPVVAAILMPMSSATMVLIATLGMRAMMHHLSLINPRLDEAHSVPAASEPILEL